MVPGFNPHPRVTFDHQPVFSSEHFFFVNLNFHNFLTLSPKPYSPWKSMMKVRQAVDTMGSPLSTQNGIGTLYCTMYTSHICILNVQSKGQLQFSFSPIIYCLEHLLKCKPIMLCLPQCMDKTTVTLHPLQSMFHPSTENTYS